MPERTITVRIPQILDAWLDAVADVRKTTRSQVVRDSISSFVVRESARVARTRHYAVIGLIARQEAWNPVDDYLAAADEIAAIRQGPASVGGGPLGEPGQEASAPAPSPRAARRPRKAALGSDGEAEPSP
jgi:hypothetical protein